MRNFSIPSCGNKKNCIFAAAFDAKKPYMVSSSNHAEVAESVDASVSKTDEVTLVPVRSRPSVLRKTAPSFEAVFLFVYSTVTDLAKFLGWSTLQPRITAMWYARICNGTVANKGE